jgi:hypothetical protein
MMSDEQSASVFLSRSFLLFYCSVCRTVDIFAVPFLFIVLVFRCVLLLVLGGERRDRPRKGVESRRGS